MRLPEQNKPGPSGCLEGCVNPVMSVWLAFTFMVGAGAGWWWVS